MYMELLPRRSVHDIARPPRRAAFGATVGDVFEATFENLFEALFKLEVVSRGLIKNLALNNTTLSNFRCGDLPSK